MNMINLESIVNLYRKNKITELSFCAEVERMVNNGSRTTVTIVEKSAKNFLVSVLPMKGMNTTRNNILVDRELILGDLFSDKEIADIIKSVASNATSIKINYFKSVDKIMKMEHGVKEILEFLIKAHVESIKNIKDEYVNRVSIDIDEILSYANTVALSNEKLPDILSNIEINGILPAPFVKEALKHGGTIDISNNNLGDEELVHVSFTPVNEPFDSSKHKLIDSREISDNYVPHGYKSS